MSNPIFQSMQSNNNILQALQSIKKNPIQFLMQKNLNIPQNISNDPDAIAQHLLNTGQVSQQVYNGVMQYLHNFTRK